jgi:hypothetical protein
MEVEKKEDVLMQQCIEPRQALYLSLSICESIKKGYEHN